MQFKYIPKRWNGRQVVSFVSVQPKPSEASYAGIAVLQDTSTTFMVIRLNADSLDPDARWDGVNGSYGLSWARAQVLLLERMKEVSGVV